MEPTPFLKCRHLVSHKYCTHQSHHQQHPINDHGRMKLKNGRTGVGDINHTVESWDQLHSR